MLIYNKNILFRGNVTHMKFEINLHFGRKVPLKNCWDFHGAVTLHGQAAAYSPVCSLLEKPSETELNSE